MRGRALPVLTQLGKSLDAVRLSLFLLTLVSISAVHMYLGPLRYARPAVLFLGLLCLSAILNHRAVAWSNLVKAWPSRLVALFFVLACASAVFGLSFGGSAASIVDAYAKVLIGFILMVAAIRNARDLALIIWSYVGACGILIVLAMTVFEMQQTSTGLDRMGGGDSMYDGNDLGMLLLMSLPLALLLLFNSRRLGKTVALAVIVGTPFVLAQTGSRGAMVGLAVMLPMLFFMLSRISLATRVGGGAVLVAALAFGAPSGYWQQMQTILDLSGDYNVASEYGRIEVAKRGVGYMLRYPIFGVGIGNFSRAEGTISPIATARQNAGLSVEWIAPHNTFVQVGAEMGVIALAVWMSLLFGGTFGLWRLRRRIPRSWEHQSADRRFLREACLFLPGSFVAFGVSSYFLSHAYTPPVYIFFALLAGLVVVVERELAVDGRAAAASAPRRRPASASPDVH